MANVHEDDRLAELAGYLPMLARLAAYESWTGVSIPHALHDADESARMVSAAFGTPEAPVAPHRPAPEPFRRDEDEPLAPGARALLRPLTGWLEEAEVHPELTDEVLRQIMLRWSR